MARIALSKKRRFDVFKRDAFACQYCGATPPGALLHVDHITPVALGGQNDTDNLITSCAACNLGKGARSLTTAPQSLGEKAKDTAEREAQLLGFQAIFQAKRERLEDETWRVLAALYGSDRDSVRNDVFASTHKFIEKLGLYEVLEAADISRASRASSDSRMFKYFCGVCWNKIRRAEEAA